LRETGKIFADFYRAVFGCTPKPPKRKQEGEWLEQGTGVKDASLEGVHLLLPGHGDEGPTLEIYTYGNLLSSPVGPANRRGLGHIAFEVADVHATAQSVVGHGGSLAGAVTEREIEGIGVVTFVYARDPEGNLIELQCWRRSKLSNP
jgi:catechol 2,3-dioxygenase-like lactoylglutathione lyase family enzyme